MTKKKEIRAADIARKLGVSPREARVALRAAGIRAPYSSKDLAKMKGVIERDRTGTKLSKAKAEAPATIN